jgi:hypothetical protein
MRLWNLLRRKTGEARLVELADSLAAQSRSDVWQRVEHQLSRMNDAEAQGYIRARAASVIAREVDRTLVRESDSFKARRQRLIELTTASVIRLVVTQARVGHHSAATRRAA